MSEFLSAFAGALLGMVAGLALGGRAATRALLAELKEKKWLRELSMKDRVVTRGSLDGDSRSKVKKARLRK